MLEIIQVIYKNSDEKDILPNTIVFLFNGDEELGLQGAHGFVKGDGSGHAWSRNLKCFINLEGAGAGGREILFQTGPGNSWIADAYAKAVKHPYDMAFIKNGWVYHTKWDKVNEIPPGSIQNVGDNALALVEYLGNLNFEDVKIEKSGTNMVFFDVFGIFMVCYNETTGIISNFVVATIFTILTVIEVGPLRIKTILTVTMLLVSTAVAWGTGVGAGAFAGAFLNWLGFYKPFYSYPFMTIVLFGVPGIFAQSLVYSFFWKGSQEKSWLAGKFTIGILLFVFSYLTRSVYILSLILVFAILAWFPRRLILKKSKRKFPVAEVASTLIISELIPFLFTSYLTITLIDVFVPIMGRSGTETDPNVFLGVLIAAITSVLTFHGIGTYFVGLKKIYLLSGLLLSIFLINPMIATGFIGNIPYQEKTPMRIQILDTDRTWYNSDMTENRTDAGYWFWPMDPNTREYFPEIAKTLPQIRDYIELEANEDSCMDLYCNQQFFRPVGKSIKKTPWVPKSYGLPYSLKDQVKMKIQKNEAIGLGLRNLTLTFQGPTQSTIIFSPTTNLEVKSWSLNTPSQSMGDMKFLGRPMYFIYLGKGYQYQARDFSLSIILEEVSTESGEPASESNDLMDVMFVGHFMHDAYQWNFKEFVEKFPFWTNVVSWSSVLKQYKISF
ncbi:unnamed protein product [Allacma fusca]|uniref:Peptidase M28 domain-containing protein n=1 Tax=Allacma fusca TaxID=39272 RepID=A0A8J2LHV3_9HEXA|nr:unnamed protein product [Allacma fusca]